MAKFLLFIFSFFLSLVCAAQQPLKNYDLQCEYLINPLGIDVKEPRLSWKTNAKQTAFQIFIDEDSIKVVNENPSVKKINTFSQQIIFSGKALQPFTKYYWKVNSSLVASFETGMMEIKNWKGAWISDSRDIKEKKAACFKKEFATKKKIKSGRAYIAVAGLYELSINGKKIGDHVLDPMYTRFDRRTLYVAYDVTKELQQGNNSIDVLLGNGWYNLQSTAVWYFDKAPWRGRPCFCLDLCITYDDNSVETLSTGKDWKTSLSPIVFNSIYTGEHIDSTFRDTSWRPVNFRSAPSQNIVAQAMQPIRACEKIPAVAINKISDTDYVFDIGRNISGVSEIKLIGEPGTIIKLKHGERLYRNGHVDISNIDVHYRPTDDSNPFATDIYTLKGGTEETFKPHFNYKGFQYVEVTSNKKIDLKKESLVAYFMHSDVPTAGKVNSSNTTLNKIWQAANNSYLSNLFGYPTDCPQREKNGWTGDAQINIETGLYNFDAITVYEKWIADHRDEQQPNGVLPSIVPSSGWGYEWGNGPDWTSTIAIIPWNLYLFYGDSKCLSDCYDNIKRYVDHINDLFPSGLCSWGLGDWIPVRSKCPVELTSTAYYFTDVTLLANAAKLFKKENDFTFYSALAKK